MQTRETLLEIKDLKVHFPIEKGLLFKKDVGSVRAVDGISFSVYKGESLGLVGESGCGKSTTIMALARLERITSGQVWFEGKDLATLNAEQLIQARKDFQIIFQDPYSSLDPRMRVIDIVAEPMRIFTKKAILTLTEKEIEEKSIGRCWISVGCLLPMPNDILMSFLVDSGNELELPGPCRLARSLFSPMNL